MREAAGVYVRMHELQAAAGAEIAALAGAEAGVRHQRRRRRAAAGGRRLHRRRRPGADEPAAGRERRARRDRRPPRPADRLRPRAADGRRAAGRDRLPRPHLPVRAGGGDRRAHRRRRLLLQQRRQRAAAGAGRRDRARARRAGDPRRLARGPAARQPETVRRARRRPRRRQRRQVDRRPGRLRLPLRPRRPDPLGRAAAAGPGRADRDLARRAADRRRHRRRPAAPGDRPRAEGRQGGDRRPARRAARLRRARPRRRPGALARRRAAPWSTPAPGSPACAPRCWRPTAASAAGRSPSWTCARSARAYALVRALADGAPAIALDEALAWRGLLRVTPTHLREGEAALVARAPSPRH